jgi:hypothetical protein
MQEGSSWAGDGGEEEKEEGRGKMLKSLFKVSDESSLQPPPGAIAVNFP